MQQASSHEREWWHPRSFARLAGLRLRAQHLVTGLITGMHRNPRGGFSTEFAEHRAYSPGDDLRRVDWRAFGRSDRLQTKHFEDETNLRSWLIVDRSRSMSYRGDPAGLSKWQYAQLMSAGLAWIILQQQDAIGLAIIDSRLRQLLPASSHRGHWDQLVRLLDQTESAGDTDIAAALAELTPQLPRRSVVFLLSDFLVDTDRLTRWLPRFVHHDIDVTLFQVVDRNEAIFPFEGTARFCGLEDDSRLVVQPDRVRDAYRSEFSAHTRALEQVCREHAAGFTQCLTDAPFDEALRAWIHASL